MANPDRLQRGYGMRSSCVRASLFCSVLIVAAGLPARGFQSRQVPTAEPERPGASQLFASTCASCHGLDGRGSERAPDIADTRRVQRLSDTEIAGIVREGIPGTGMPAFHALGDLQVREIVAYLRTLQGQTRQLKLPGDPSRGRRVFFGKAGCSSCHMVTGEGGFLASDLSGYGSTHSIAETRAAIVRPSGGRQTRRATAITSSGEKLVGRVRNEDNFSVQLQTSDGVFHFLRKSDLQSLEYNAEPIMPADYGSTLSANELNDLISFLMHSANRGEAGIARQSSEEEQ